MMQGLWVPWARLLKVLPLSVRQINALLLFTSTATWTILWLAGVFLYSLSYGMPETLRIDFAFALAGFAALANAMWFRFHGGNGAGLIMGTLGGLISPIVKFGLRDGTIADIVFAAVGAIAFCAGAFINHRTLTRSTSSSRSYQRPRRFQMSTAAGNHGR
jgi:hypothetical protein